MISSFMLLALFATVQTDGAAIRDHAPALSPDGRSIAYYSYRNGLPDIYVFDRQTGEIRQLTDTPELWEIEPFWSPDGTQLAFPAGISMRRLTFRMADITTGTTHSVPFGLRVTGPASLSADGQAFFFFERHVDGDRLWRADINGVGHLVSNRLPEGRNSIPQATPDGQSLVFLNTAPDADAADIYALDLATGAIRQISETPWDEGYLGITPDSLQVTFSAEIEGGTRDLYSLPLDEHAVARHRPAPLLSFEGNTRFFSSIDPDGTIAYDEVADDGGARIWILEPDAPRPQMLPLESYAPY